MPLYGSDIKNITTSFTSTDSTNWKDVFDPSAIQGNTHAVRVEELSITSDDTSTVNIQFALNRAGTLYLLGTVRVITLSGTDGAAVKISALTAGNVGILAPDGIYDLWLEPTVKLQAKSLVAVSSNKTVTIAGRVRTYA